MKRIFTIFLAVLLVVSALALPVFALSPTESPVTASILQAQMKKADVSTVQELIDYHADHIGDGFEWYVMTFALMGEPYRYDNYCVSLLRHIEEHPVTNPVTRQKYALTLLACSYTAEFIETTKNDSLGKLGTMSYIFGLHLANFGYAPDGLTVDDVVDKLLAIRNPDGGFSLDPGTSDIDVTAMALQALIFHYDKREDVKKAVDDGVLLLSGWQNENGSYSSGKVENPESAAQTVIALSSLGIDVTTDSRFVKNGKTMVESMLSFEKKPGEYAHTHDTLANGASTRQVFLADMAMQKMKTARKNFFAPLADHYTLISKDTVIPPPETTEKAETATPTESEKAPEITVTPTKNKVSYKIYVTLTIVGIALLSCLLLFLMKKRNYKQYLAVLLLTILAVGITLFTNFESKNAYYEETTGGTQIGTVTLSISCDTLVGNYESKYIPSDGVILAPAEIAVYENDTAYTVLQRAAKQYKIQMEVSGAGDMLYVEGIAYLYELQYGDYSGWMYAVNGKSASVGCNQYPVKDGDRISWDYTRDLGHDLSYS